MALGEVFERFAKQCPLPVLVRGSLEWALAAERLDPLFEETAQRQYVSEVAFSTVVDLMAMVVAKTRKSLHAAYQAHQESIQVSVWLLHRGGDLQPAQRGEGVVARLCMARPRSSRICRTIMWRTRSAACGAA